MIRRSMVAALALLALSVGADQAQAQTFVVATCGSLPVAYVAGMTGRPVTIDLNGQQCGAPISVLPALGITPTDRTLTSATGASQTVMAANAARHAVIVVNTGNANCGINPTGGTAAIGGAGTLTLSPTGSYSPRIPSLAALTAICTAGQPLYAEEN